MALEWFFPEELKVNTVILNTKIISNKTLRYSTSLQRLSFLNKISHTV